MRKSYQDNRGKLCACGMPAAAKGMCAGCYQRGRYEKTTKPCKYEGCGCRTSRPDGYCAHHRDQRPACSRPGCGRKTSRSDGLCQRHYNGTVRAQAVAAGHTQALKDRAKRTGVATEIVLYLRQVQGGKCAICKVEMSPGAQHGYRETSDHCHDTGFPRGLLCGACNTVLGWYQRWQRPAGLVISQYESYLNNYPAPPPLPEGA